MCEYYKNFTDLLEQHKKLAYELLHDKGTGQWQTEEIYCYDDIETFAEYELFDGWYADLNLDRHFNGAPNPVHFIDLFELGHALVRSWDESCYFKSHNGKVLQTNVGW
ncbi:MULTISPECIES: hypothetical protein [Vagococcus]|uniref:hypothetical protein n=1 Tax=Vagococcus TaxID=2737 RepID=UPI000E4690F9|nr:MULTISPECIES: hypothetical protein [Vagococcus]RHH66296.1 hypothetical protein DW196_10925 [Vagococcus sp. AM17-17]